MCQCQDGCGNHLAASPLNNSGFWGRPGCSVWAAAQRKGFSKKGFEQRRIFGVAKAYLRMHNSLSCNPVSKYNSSLSFCCLLFCCCRVFLIASVILSFSLISVWDWMGFISKAAGRASVSCSFKAEGHKATLGVAGSASLSQSQAECDTWTHHLLSCSTRLRIICCFLILIVNSVQRGRQFMSSGKGETSLYIIIWLYEQVIEAV